MTGFTDKRICKDCGIIWAGMYFMCSACGGDTERYPKRKSGYELAIAKDKRESATVDESAARRC